MNVPSLFAQSVKPRAGIKAPESIAPVQNYKGCDLHECRCSCHVDTAGYKTEHCGSCCEVAPCGMNIINGALQTHVHLCEKCGIAAQENCR